MQSRQDAINNAPFNWQVVSNDGTNIVANNRVTGASFSGTLAAFAAKVFDPAYPSSYSESTYHWVNGVLFWIPAGDGGANGLNFTGNGTGSFAISAVFAGLTTGSFGFVYLPANAGNSGNAAGWHYFIFTGAQSGKMYNFTYDSTSGLYPIIPTAPTELAFTSSARITTTTSEVQVVQLPFNYTMQMGINGMLEAILFGLGGTGYFRAGSNLLYSNDFVGSGMQQVYVNINNAGSMSKQITMRHNCSLGSITGSLNGNYKTVDLALETTFNVSLKLVSTTSAGLISLYSLKSIFRG